jgi:hypothetical protein
MAVNVSQFQAHNVNLSPMPNGMDLSAAAFPVTRFKAWHVFAMVLIVMDIAIFAILSLTHNGKMEFANAFKVITKI